jgi:8-oxo-dGTP pyrophosphatase MutT (NUDIX family)
MKTKKDYSYGVLPIRRQGDKWEIFLIHQYSRIGNNTYWVFPKGHPEAGETPVETASRELKEETALVPEEIIEEPTFNSEYSFFYDGSKIEKVVVFFIGIITDAKPVLDEREVTEAGWYTLEEAEERLDYKATKKMYQQARQYIETLERA